MWTIKGEILCTIRDMNRTKKDEITVNLGALFAVTLH